MVVRIYLKPSTSKLFDVSPKAWSDVSVPGHFDRLLLTGIRVVIQCFHSCLPVCWREQKDGAGGDDRDLCFPQQSKRTSPFLCPREMLLPESDGLLGLPSSFSSQCHGLSADSMAQTSSASSPAGRRERVSAAALSGPATYSKSAVISAR